MTAKVDKETLGFQTEVRQLLDLMIHSLYGNKEIFLRELISNASDAADKLRFEALSDDGLYGGDGDLEIRVDYDKEARTVTVSDNGIGLGRDEVVEQIGTIAKSGTREFFESLTGDQTKDTQLIGQFGVGFYSSFIVAERVTLTTRRAGLRAAEGVRWSSDGKGEFTIETKPKKDRGTEVVLHLREGEDEFLDGFRLRSIIRKYSDHISLPIMMRKESTGDDGAGAESEEAEGAESEETETEAVNSTTALWTRAKGEIEKEEYEEFYRHVAHDFDAPLDYVHTKVEGNLEYTSLLYIPGHAPFDLWDRDRRHGIKLYVRRVFVMDDAEQLMPLYLRFVRGIVDSSDLPLNISREILQNNKQIEAIRSGSVKRVLGLLDKMSRDDAEKYATFWEQFGRVLKEGVFEDPKNRDDIAKLLRFGSTRSDSEAEEVALDDYVGRMKEGQEKIYYITADNRATARNSPHIEVFVEKGVEVLLMTDAVDEFVVTHLTEFAGKKLQSVTKGELDLGEIGGEEAAGEEEPSEEGADCEELIARITDALGERVKKVRVTHRLTTSPACLVADENEMGAHLERILKSSGQKIGGGKPVMEINPKHPIVKRMQAHVADESISEWAHILHDQALLSEGGQLEDPAGFVKRMNDLFEALTAGS